MRSLKCSRFLTAPSTRIVIAALLIAVAFVAVRPLAAFAGHMTGWTHDHSSNGIPARPSGYNGLVNRFGQPCSDAANNARSYWPSAAGRNVGGYVQYHPYIARNVGHNVRSHIEAAHRNGAVDYLVSGYVCRPIRDSTLWSTHAFGAAIDTNTARNPLGQDHWDGRGADGTDYGTYVPGVWTAHNFYWGIHWDRPDPMHFQYVTNY